MNRRFASGIPSLGKNIQVPAVAAFTLFISQQLPAQANHHHNHGGGHNVRNNAADFKNNGWKRNDNQRFAAARMGFQTVNLDAARPQNVNLNNGIHLDLGSHMENITLGAKLFGDQAVVKITVGGAEKTLQAGSQVTAAEYVAAKQVLSGTGQSLTISGDGSASGGRVDFGAILDGDEKMRASSLVNPQGVTVAGDFGKRSDFQLRGDLTNYGSLYAYSSKDNARAGTIRAHDINNEEGAKISTLLPDSLRNDLQAAHQSVDLRLHADHDLNNYGVIEGGGNVSLSAGNQINNASAQATVTAHNDVSLDAANIVNRGTISSAQGNINLDASSPSMLMVDNRFGVLRADNGAINIRSDSYDQSFDTYVYGGDLVSSLVNLNSGQGLLTVEVGELTGTVTQKGTAVHLLASTDELTLGEACLLGDPTFYNTAGDINIIGDISINSQALTIVASGNINLNGGSDLIAGSFSQGFPITLIAGANITATAGGANQPNLGPIPPANGNNGGVTINGGSATGGAINFNAVGTVIDSRAQLPLANTNGGDVLMVAFAGANANTGRINSPPANNGSILTGGTGFGNNGNITVIAPGDLAISILPGMNTSGGLGSGGNITVTAADPIANNVVYNANGTLALGGPVIVPSAALKPNGSLQFAEFTDAGDAFIQASANDLVQLNLSQQMFARGVTMISETGRVGIFGPVNASSFFIASGDDVQTANAGLNLGTVSSPNIILTSATGDIGAGGALGFRVDGLGGSNALVQVNGHDNVSILSNGFEDLVMLDSSADGTGTFEVRSDSQGIFIFGDIIVNDGDIILNATNIAGGNDVFILGGKIVSTSNGSLTAQAGNGNVTVGSSALLDATNGVTLLVAAAGSTISTGDSVTLTTTGGDVNIVGGAGGVDIGNTTIHTDVGDVNISTIGGSIDILAANISTGDGTIGVINSGTDKKTSKINLTGTIMNTLGQPTNGDITISVGTIGLNVLGKAPKKNLTITPPVGNGTIFFGARGITTNAPQNTLTVINADIIFNNPLNRKNIVLSGVNITADPPSAPGVESFALSAPAAVETLRNSIAQFPMIESAINETSIAQRSESILSTVLPDGINLVTAQQLMTKHAQSPLEVSTKLLGNTNNDDSYITTYGGIRSTVASIYCETANSEMNKASLSEETVFFAPTKDTSVETQFGKVSIAGGSLAMVTATPAGLAVFNLHDTHKNAISLTTANGENLFVAPGCHILVTPHGSRDFTDVNSVERVAHRAVSKHGLKNGFAAFCSEFHIPSAVESQHAIKTWLHSDNARTRRQAERAMKTWAALFDLRRSSEQYKHYVKTPITAMADTQQATRSD